MYNPFINTNNKNKTKATQNKNKNGNKCLIFSTTHHTRID
jgi:hypothetical protein